MSTPSKPGLLVGMLGLWVFLALAVPLMYFFGAQVFPEYQCDYDCTMNDSAGALTGLAFLAAVLAVVFGLPQIAPRQPGEPRAARIPQRRPIVLRRMAEPAPPPSGAPGFLVRLLVYVMIALAGAFVLFWVGGAHFEASFCSDPNFDGECDVAVAEGFVWSGTWVVLVLLAGACIELQLIVNWLLRRRGLLPEASVAK